MRIISGKYKGRIIKGFDINGTRPTMERVKESLFGMIQDYLSDSYVLDLFSGSGNLGIEALSWGAKYAYLCDNNKIAINTIKENISSIGIKNAKVIDNDYLNILDMFHKDNIFFDIIFLDPPYKSNYIEESIKMISKYNLLNDNGIIICETDNIDKIIYPESLYAYKTRQYSDKYIVILKKI